MSTRADELHEAADQQIARLTDRLASASVPGLREPCPGRDKLGDGSIAAVAVHTTENFRRIADFVTAVTAGRAASSANERHGGFIAVEVDLPVLLEQLGDARQALALIGELSDEQLESVPPAGPLRFADGERSFEQIVMSLVKHQRHQVDAIVRALS